MGRYDSHKFPFHYQMNSWAQKRINSRVEREAKSIPCHVVKVDKDFIYVQFETQNNIFTPPTVKIPKSHSQYSREPTQVGDKGYAVPGNYYLGGVTGDAGGNTDFYPRGNLTTLSFNGISHTTNPNRDYDQLTHMGGPNGWIVGPFQQQQQDQQSQNGNGGGGSISFAATMRAGARTQAFRNAQTQLTSTSTTGSTSTSSSSQNGQQQDLTQFSFDKNGKAIVQSKDANHNVTVDQQNTTVSMTSSQTIFHDPSGGICYVGGNPQNGMARILTEKGPSPFAYARVS